MERDEFLRAEIIVHLNSKEEAEVFFDYYRQHYGIGEHNTLNFDNLDRYHYAFAYENQDAIHGYGYEHPEKDVEFDDWAERVGLHSYEFNESDKALSFLFE